MPDTPPTPNEMSMGTCWTYTCDGKRYRDQTNDGTYTDTCNVCKTETHGKYRSRAAVNNSADRIDRHARTNRVGW